MNKSTRLFFIIIGSLVVVGIGGTLLLYLMFMNFTERNTEVIIGSGEKIAVIELKGAILSSEDIVRQFKKYRKDRSIRAILFRVDSPGGGVVASQEIYEEVKRTREEGKLVVVSMGTLAASGGYYVSCAANKIVSNFGTLTGSIGVIAQFLHFDSLMRKIGVSVNTIKSGKFKDAGSPFRGMTKADKAYFQSLMDEVHHQFINAVASQRKLDYDSVVAFADGRVFTGEQALQMGLVDTLGTFEDAIMITAELAGIKGKPAIVKERKRGFSLFERLFGKSKISDLLELKENILNQPILQYKMVQAF